MNAILLGILAYVLLQFAIGAWVSRRMTNEADYILAGRSLGTALVTFSVFATYFGAEAIVASGGEVYKDGLSAARTDPLSYALAIFLVGVLFARALWSRGLTTFADLFRQRYSPGVERLVVIVLLPGSIIWAAAQVRVFGGVMHLEAGLSLAAGIALAAVLVGAYSVVGGLLADAVTDVIQGIAVLLGLIILGAIIVQHVGGIPAGLAQLEPEKLQMFTAEDSVLDILERFAIPVCGTVVAVELISRFLGARSADVAMLGTAAGGVLYFVIGLIPVFLGLMAIKLLPDLQTASAEDAEQVIARLAREYMPNVLYVTFVGAIISAVLSVVHSALHAPAAQVSHNIVVRMIPGLTDRAKLWSVRLTVLALCVVTYIIAVTSEGVRELVETASAFGSAGVFVTALFALFTRFGGPLSAYLSISAGMLVWAAGKFALGLPAPYLAGLTAAGIAYVAGAVVSLNADQDRLNGAKN